MIVFFWCLEVDIHIPDQLKSYFKDIPPLFSSTEVRFDYSSMSKIMACPTNQVNFWVEWVQNPIIFPIPEMASSKWTKSHQVTSSRGIHTPMLLPKFVLEVSDARQAEDGAEHQKIIVDTTKLIGNSGYRSLVRDDERHQVTV